MMSAASGEMAAFAAKNGVNIEITTRKGHSATNKEVVKMALKAGAKIVFNTDTHTPENMLTLELMEKTLSEAGLAKDYYQTMLENSLEIVNKYK